MDLSDVKILNKIDTEKGTWRTRKEICLKNVYTSMSSLIEASKKPNNKFNYFEIIIESNGLLCLKLSKVKSFYANYMHMMLVRHIFKAIK